MYVSSGKEVGSLCNCFEIPGGNEVCLNFRSDSSLDVGAVKSTNMLQTNVRHELIKSHVKLRGSHGSFHSLAELVCACTHHAVHLCAH